MSDDIPAGFDYEATLERHRADLRNRPTGKHWSALSDDEVERLAKQMTDKSLESARDSERFWKQKYARQAEAELARSRRRAEFRRLYSERFRG